jgi:hypothetical protein
MTLDLKDFDDDDEEFEYCSWFGVLAELVRLKNETVLEVRRRRGR